MAKKITTKLTAFGILSTLIFAISPFSVTNANGELGGFDNNSGYSYDNKVKYSFNISAIDTSAENNLFCSNVLHEAAGKKLSIAVKSKITKIIKKIGNSHKYSDKKIFLVNKKILQLAEKKANVRNDIKKYALYMFVATELDRIMGNKNILSAYYKTDECTIAYNKFNVDINQIATNKGYINANYFENYGFDGNEKDDTLIGVNLDGNQADYSQNTNTTDGFNQTNNDGFVDSETELTAAKKKQIEERKKMAEKRKNMNEDELKKDLKKEATKKGNEYVNKLNLDRNDVINLGDSLSEAQRKKIVDDYLKNADYWGISEEMKDYIKKTFYKYDDGSLHMRNGYLWDDKYLNYKKSTLLKKHHIINEYFKQKQEWIIADDLLEEIPNKSVIKKGKNIYKKLKDFNSKRNIDFNSDKTTGTGSLEIPSTIRGTSTTFINSKKKSAFLLDLNKKTNTYKKYQLRSILTPTNIKIVNGEKYIQNVKGKWVPLDYYGGQENIEDYNINNKNFTIGYNKFHDKGAGILLGYRRMEKIYKPSSRKTKLLFIKGNDPRLDTMTGSTTNEYVFIYGPNENYYKTGLSKREYQELDNLKKQEKNILAELKKIKIKLLNINHYDRTKNMALQIINKDKDRIKVENEKKNYEKKLEAINEKKADLYYRWLERKNACYAPRIYEMLFDKDNLTRIYQNYTKEFGDELRYDRYDTLTASKKYKNKIYCK